MIPDIDILHETGYFSDLDFHFARAMNRLAGGGEDPLVLLGAAAASRFTARGGVCADLGCLAGTRLETEEGELLEGPAWPDSGPWLAALRGSPMVGDGEAPTPLVLDGAGRLYLTRYWRYQERLAKQLRERADLDVDDPDAALLAEGLGRLFPAPDKTASDSEKEGVAGQRLAALMAVLRRLTVISGGPGTGKTFTVVKILALLIEQSAAADRAPSRILLTAPTGKAAARLAESIRMTTGGIRCGDRVKDAVPKEAATIHRILRPRRNKPTRFRHDIDNPLPVDVLVVDEASMVDLALMTKLVEATPPRARLILLGDKDQLSSVEAGAIIGDIYRAGARRGYSASFARRVLELTGAKPPQVGEQPQRTGIRDSVIHLAHSFRFGPESGIGRLAGAINRADADAAIDCLEDDAFPDVELVEVNDISGLHRRLEAVVREYYGPYLEKTGDLLKRLKLFDGFRILCAHRRGGFGVEGVNRLIEGVLSAKGGMKTEGEWYDGRPVLVTQNDYRLNLFNGDVGLIGPAKPGSGELRAYFTDGEGSLRSVAPSRLPPHETVYAMTVHKSQGSEFDHVMVVLPERRSPVVTRELVYTAVSRARKSVLLCATKDLLCAAVKTGVGRASGLSEKL